MNYLRIHFTILNGVKAGLSTLKNAEVETTPTAHED